MEPTSLPLDFIQLSNRFRRIKMMEIFGEASKGEFFVMDTLHWHEAKHPDSQGMYASDLATAMHILPPALSRLLKAMEAKGYLERIVDQERRRNTYIRLTPKGRQTRQQIRGQMLAFSNRVIDVMGEDDLRQLMQLWEKLMTIVETEAGRMEAQPEQTESTAKQTDITAKRTEGDRPNAEDHQVPG